MEEFSDTEFELLPQKRGRDFGADVVQEEKRKIPVKGWVIEPEKKGWDGLRMINGESKWE